MEKIIGWLTRSKIISICIYQWDFNCDYSPRKIKERKVGIPYKVYNKNNKDIYRYVGESLGYDINKCTFCSTWCNYKLKSMIICLH